MSQDFRSIVCGTPAQAYSPGRTTAQHVKGRSGMRIHGATGALVACVSLIALSACSDEATAPPRAPDMAKAGIDPLAAEVRRLILTPGREITPMERGPVVRPALVRLGQA